MKELDFSPDVWPCPLTCSHSDPTDGAHILPFYWVLPMRLTSLRGEQPFPRVSFLSAGNNRSLYPHDQSKGKFLNQSCFHRKATQVQQTCHLSISDDFDLTCEILTLAFSWQSTRSSEGRFSLPRSSESIPNGIKLPLPPKHVCDLQIFLGRAQGQRKNFSSFNHKY